MGAFENITDKLVLLLKKTKDALLLDIEKEFSSIREAIQKADADSQGTPSSFKEALVSTETVAGDLKKVVDAVFARVGIDLTQCQNLQDFNNLLGKPLDLLEKLGDNLEGITDSSGNVDYTQLFKVLLDAGKDIAALVKGFQDVEMSAIKTELNTTFGNAYDDFDLEDFARSILEHILLTLLKNGEDVFSEEIRYAKFKANEVYKEMSETVQDVRDAVQTGIENYLKGVGEKAQEVEKVVRAFFKETVQEATDAYNAAKEEVEDAVKEFRQALQDAQKSEEYRMLVEAYEKISSAFAKIYAVLDFMGIVGKKRLELKVPESFIKQLQSVGPAVNRVMKGTSSLVEGFVSDTTNTLNGALAGTSGLLNSAQNEVETTVNDAFDTMAGAVNTVTGEHYSLTLDLMDIPTLSIPDYSDEIAAVSTAMNAAFQEKINGVTGNVVNLVSGFSYPFTITTFRWGRIERMFKDPISYFKDLYPMNGIDDVENLTAKIIGLLRLFNPDIPDYRSLRGLLESLLRKLGEMVLAAAKDAKKDLWTQVKPLMATIRKVLDLLQEMYETLKLESAEILKIIKDEVTKNLIEPLLKSFAGMTEKAKKEAEAVVGKLKELLAQINTPKFLDEIYTEIVAPAVVEAVRESDAPNPEAKVKNAVAASKAIFEAWGTGVYNHLTTFFNETAWKDRLNRTIGSLAATFQEDMDAVKGFLSPSLLNDFSAISGKASALKDELDISQYIDILSSAFNGVSVPDPELYYEGFKQAVHMVAKKASGLGDGYDESQLKDFATDVAAGIWERVRDKVLKPLIRELKRQLLRMIRKALNILLKKILKDLPSFAILNKKDINTLRLFLNEAGKRVKDVTNIADIYEQEGLAAALGQSAVVLNDFIDIPIPSAWQKAAKNIAAAAINFGTSDMSYAEVLKLIIALYQNIPDGAATWIRDILPSFPSNQTVNSFVQFVKGMDYKADLDQTFAIVTVVDVGDKNQNDNGPQSGTQGSASALLQLAVFAGEVNADYEEKKEASLFCMVIVQGKVSLTFDIGKNHTMTLGVSGGVGSGPVKEIQQDENGKNQLAKLEKGVGFRISKDWDFTGIARTDSLNAMFVMQFFRKNAGDNNLQVFDSQYLALSMKNYPQQFYLGFARSHPDFSDTGFSISTKPADENQFQVGYFGAVQGGEVRLKLQDVAFIKEVIKDDVVLNFDTYVLFDLHKGFDFGGGVNLHLDYDLNHKKIGPVTIDSFSLDAGVPQGESGKLRLAVGTTFQVDFAGALVVAIENLGIGFLLNYKDENGDFGDLDLDASLQYPTGIGITVDATAVKGAGTISIDQETGEFFGMLALDILKKIGVSGYLLCDPGTAQGHFFSLIVLLSAEFHPGIPLGMGFSLTAIGGTIGLNRQISRDAIQSGVRAGTLDQVFFVGNIMEHKEKLGGMKSNIITYFPAKKGQFFFGLLGQISFEPIVECDFGLLLQLPSPTEIIIMGALRVNAAEGIVRINVYFAGGINFAEGMWFDASIVDSQIVGITISGDMAFRLNWGGQKGFLLSIGGFHPAYKPEEGLHVGKMNRLAMKLDYDILKISFETYMAVTSNTFQIGARLDLKIGWSGFGIIGYAGFDALFQFDPFLFMFYLCAGVSIVVSGTPVLSIDLALDVQGPAPWRISGYAKFKLLLIPVKVEFTKTWGKKAPELPSKSVEVFPLLLEQWNDDHNWSVDNIDLTGRVHVTLFNHESDEMILQPDGSITFNQSTVPLRTEDALEKMDICNDAVPSDYDSLQIAQIKVNESGVDAYGNEENDFAPTLFKSMTIQEKLDSPSYVKYNSGFTLNEKENLESLGTPKTMTRNVNHEFCEYATTGQSESSDVEFFGLDDLRPSGTIGGKGSGSDYSKGTGGTGIQHRTLDDGEKVKDSADGKKLVGEILSGLQTPMKKVPGGLTARTAKSVLDKVAESRVSSTVIRLRSNINPNIQVQNVEPVTTAKQSDRVSDYFEYYGHTTIENHGSGNQGSGSLASAKLKLEPKANTRRDRVSFERYLAVLEKKAGIKSGSTR